MLKVRTAGHCVFMRSKVARFCAGLLLTIATIQLVGCGPEGEPTYKLSGAVTYNDQPVANGLINFFPPNGGRPIGGPFGDDGMYEVRLPSGEYNVLISVSVELPEGWQEGDPIPPSKSAIPARYSHPKGSGLTVVVGTDSSQEHDFNLK